MKKTIFSLVVLTGVVSAETYTWTPQDGSNQWGTSGNWQTSAGTAASSLPIYTNNEVDTYVVGNGANISAINHSVGNLGASLFMGDNVSLSANWAFIFQNITIGKGFSYDFVDPKDGKVGDGIKWGVDAKVSETVNKLSLNSAYSHNAKILTSIGVGSSIDFGTDGSIDLSKYVESQNNNGTHLGGKKLALSAAITLNDAAASGEIELFTRYLITGNNIWYRDVVGDKAMVDYTSSAVKDTNGTMLTQYELAKSEGADWIINGQKVETAALAAGAYRFVATEQNGIGIQYWNNTIPEPTTATLSLLALAGLAASRRRK